MNSVLFSCDSCEHNRNRLSFYAFFLFFYFRQKLLSVRKDLPEEEDDESMIYILSWDVWTNEWDQTTLFLWEFKKNSLWMFSYFVAQSSFRCKPFIRTHMHVIHSWLYFCVSFLFPCVCRQGSLFIHGPLCMIYPFLFTRTKYLVILESSLNPSLFSSNPPTNQCVMQITNL